MSAKGTKTVHREMHVYTGDTYTCIGRECIGCSENAYMRQKRENARGGYENVLPTLLEGRITPENGRYGE